MCAWKEHDPEEILGLLWRRVAYGTRYGRAGLREVLQLDTGDLDHYLTELAKIVSEENQSQSASFQGGP